MGLSDLVKKATGGVQTPEKPRSGSISSRTTPGGNGDQDSVDKGAEGDDVSVLDEKEGNVILAMISQRELSSALPLLMCPAQSGGGQRSAGPPAQPSP